VTESPLCATQLDKGLTALNLTNKGSGVPACECGGGNTSLMEAS